MNFSYRARSIRRPSTCRMPSARRKKAIPSLSNGQRGTGESFQILCVPNRSKTLLLGLQRRCKTYRSWSWRWALVRSQLCCPGSVSRFHLISRASAASPAGRRSWNNMGLDVLSTMCCSQFQSGKGLQDLCGPFVACLILSHVENLCEFNRSLACLCVLRWGLVFLVLGLLHWKGKTMPANPSQRLLGCLCLPRPDELTEPWCQSSCQCSFHWGRSVQASPTSFLEAKSSMRTARVPLLHSQQWYQPVRSPMRGWFFDGQPPARQWLEQKRCLACDSFFNVYWVFSPISSGVVVMISCCILSQEFVLPLIDIKWDI